MEENVEFNSTLRRIVLLGTLALTVLLLFHLPYDDVAGQLLPIAGWWIALHTIVFGLVPFMGVALWMLSVCEASLPPSAGWQRWSLHCSTMPGTP